MDNLNTHFHKCFEDVLGTKEARTLLRRVVFHYTPKHASWLNMAEIGILDRQRLDRRLPDRPTLTAEVDAWQQPRRPTSRSQLGPFRPLVPIEPRFHPRNPILSVTPQLMGNSQASILKIGACYEMFAKTRAFPIRTKSPQRR